MSAPQIDAVPSEGPAGGGEPRLSGPGMAAELAMPIVLAAFAIYLGIGLVTMRVPEGTSFPGPRFFPGIIAGALVVLVIAQVVVVLQRHTPLAADRRLPAGRDEAEGIAGTVTRRAGLHLPSFAWAVGGFLLFALLLEVLGWVIGAAMLFWCVARAFGSPRVLMDVVVGLTLSSLAYIVFDMMLGLSLPSGILGWGF
ncbi:tripartite tricarboxylate transporter TctB family protein [Brachybacterium hainanense]|uniref:Tripartite tricarboxylate transporter TctB family protein n=1 Tax=Brachybacterium hainanense TaxID=1541174 RepID=A0ABV6R7J0_9MICO